MQAMHVAETVALAVEARVWQFVPEVQVVHVGGVLTVAVFPLFGNLQLFMLKTCNFEN